jgi:hypothetical protein
MQLLFVIIFIWICNRCENPLIIMKQTIFQLKVDYKKVCEFWFIKHYSVYISDLLRPLDIAVYFILEGI